ncbi:MAG: hypothetical protein KDC73_05935 [Ignavibacteriae bacterium]|nr:hypothetical protein [Ignavibacteriota bacterium]MCB9243733.1 hypothetical protein [Ignavibacteriales bacterium]
MAKDFTITITQVVGGNYQPVTNLSNLNLRKDPFSSSTYSGTHIGDGAYAFTDVEDGVYKLFNDTIEVTKWGGSHGRWIGDETLDYLPGDGGGHWDAQDKRIHNVSDPVSGIDVGDRDYNDARYLLLSGGTLTGNINLGGNKIINPGDPSDDSQVGDRGYNDNRYPTRIGDNTFIGKNQFLVDTSGTKYPKIFYDDELSGETYFEPTHPLHISTKQYADSLVAGITVPAVPYSGNEVIVIGGITQVVGKIYSSILNAANHLSTLGLNAQKRGVMYVRNHPQINYYIAAPGSLKDYMNVMGYAPAFLSSSGDPVDWNNVGTIIIVCEKTATKKMTISNSTLIFGDSNLNITQNQTGERAYNGFVFTNCVIFAYNDTAFNNCILNSCLILHSSVYKATCTGCKIINCTFNNDPDVDNTSSPVIYSGNFTWTDIPNDITAYIPDPD